MTAALISRAKGRRAAAAIGAVSLGLLTLSACCFVDLGAVAAGWNVRHAREAGGHGAQLDLCYLNEIDASALLPLIEMESRPLPPRSLSQKHINGSAAPITISR